MAESVGRLFLVPTPIGNLADFTERAKSTLASVALIACEDTRSSGRMIRSLGITVPLVSYHEFNERSRAVSLAEQLRSGADIAVISDAGSPGISDPAYRIVQLALEVSARIIALPGPCAIIPALTASGLPTDRFFFDGFLPHKSSQRRKRFAELADLEHTLIFYESPHRIAKSLSDAAEILPHRMACIAREISKLHEEYLRGTIAELAAHTAQKDWRGEIVFLIEGHSRRVQQDERESDHSNDA